MRWYLVIRHARIFTLAALVAAAPLSVFAQSGQSRLAITPATAAEQPNGARQLSIDEAVRLALEQNLGIKIQRFDPQIQDVGIASARSSWMPQLSSTLTKNTADNPQTSILSGAQPVITTGQFATGVSLTETLPWGANYTASWNNGRFTTNDPTFTFNPRLSSNIQFNFTQPLLRNFEIDAIRQQVATSKKVRDLSDIQLRSVVTQTLRNVKNAYWDLVYALNNYKAQEQSLALSQQSLKDNQKRVEIGTLAPIDIVQSQAEVANNEQGVIVADAQIKQAQDNLRSLILDPAMADFWGVTFDPTDAATYAEQAIDIDAAVRNALDKRTDLLSAKNSLEQSDINIKFYGNQIRPDVNAIVNYAAVGVAGTQQTGGTNPFTGQTTPITIVDRSYGSALADVFGSSYPQWSVGVQIGYPLGASAAHANLARVKLEYDQSQAQLRSLQLQVATQVRAVARQVTTNQKRVQAARASRELQEKKLDAEEKKLAAGMSSTFLVLQAQRDLSLARTTEVQAVSDYNKSLVDFEAVQEVPLGGGGSQVIVAR